MGRSTIYGRGGDAGRPYLTRLWIGRLRLHIFHKGDQDPDPHDHPWDFWTFPLMAYWEMVFYPRTGTERLEIVRAWRPSFRPATHTHRVIGSVNGRALITLVWRGPVKRGWGFWAKVTDDQGRWDKGPRKRRWTRWDQYLESREG